MSYLLFLDESGHDHKNAPYEVRGGVAIHSGKLWPFVQSMKNLEVACFGDALHCYGSEIKGHRLLDKDRFRWAAQQDEIDDAARRKHCLSFLNKGTQKEPAKQVPTRFEFSAYGQASLKMARGMFQLLQAHGAKLFAAVIPRNVNKPDTFQAEEYLRKDQVFLLERFFYFLEAEEQFGLLVLDETEKQQDRRFVRRLERYFSATHNGRSRTSRIVPSPFFVSSDMTYPIQAADLCIYCVNHGFRLPARGMSAPVRTEIQSEFGAWLARLQFKGQGYKDGDVFDAYGIVYVENPYGTGGA